MTMQNTVIQIAAFRRVERTRMLKALAVPVLALLVLIAAVAWVRPSILSARAFAGFGTDAAPLLLLVIGSTTVILLGGIDLSIAAMASFAAVAFVQISDKLGDFGIPTVLSIAACFGALQGYVHAKAQIPSFVVSFGTLGALYGFTHFISHATAAPLTAPSVLIEWFAGRSFGVPNGLIVVALVAAGLRLGMRYTRFGRDLYSVGASERAALLSGVRTIRVRMLAFAISSFCAALAGLLLLSQTSYSSPAMANNLLLPSIVGVVVGGTAISGGVGGIGCALVGGMIAVGVRLGTVIVGLSPAFQDIVFGSVIVVAVALTIDREKIGIIK